MITDILDSSHSYPKLNILNNLSLTPTKEYLHNLFEFEFVDKILGDCVLGGVKPNVKQKIFESFSKEKKLNFINLISKNTNISKTVKLGKGVVINCGVSIAGHTTLEDYVFINRNVSIGHHTNIGKFTTVNPGCNIAGNVKIGMGCQIGIGANIIDGITIGDNVIIGAGSIVTKDVESNVVAYGIPCRKIKENLTE